MNVTASKLAPWSVVGRVAFVLGRRGAADDSHDES
jgi:hypothetical protein